MFDHPQLSPSKTHGSRPHAYNVAVSLSLAASVPAVIWAVSYPLSTVLVVVAATVVVLGVRTHRARAADQPPPTASPAVAVGQSDGR